MSYPQVTENMTKEGIFFDKRIINKTCGTWETQAPCSDGSSSGPCSHLGSEQWREKKSLPVFHLSLTLPFSKIQTYTHSLMPVSGLASISPYWLARGYFLCSHSITYHCHIYHDEPLLKDKACVMLSGIISQPLNFMNRWSPIILSKAVACFVTSWHTKRDPGLPLEFVRYPK